jgi:hypothetical protein
VSRAESPQFPVGSRVLLKGCRFGEPGTVLRIQRRKVATLRPDLDYIGRHSPDSLMPFGEGLIKPMGESDFGYQVSASE